MWDKLEVKVLKNHLRTLKFNVRLSNKRPIIYSILSLSSSMSSQLLVQLSEVHSVMISKFQADQIQQLTDLSLQAAKEVADTDDVLFYLCIDYNIDSI